VDPSSAKGDHQDHGTTRGAAQGGPQRDRLPLVAFVAVSNMTAASPSHHAARPNSSSPSAVGCSTKARSKQHPRLRPIHAFERIKT
jgi:hypothetical protein